MEKTVFFVSLSPALARTVNRRGGLIPDPPLSSLGRSLAHRLRHWIADTLPAGPAEVHCGEGARFLDAAAIVFPDRKEFHVSPLWGDATIDRLVNGRKCILLSNGLVFGKEYHYVHDLRTSTLDSVLNLPDNSVVIAEIRPLLLLGMPRSAFRCGALYRVHSAGAFEPFHFDLIAAPRHPSASAA